MSDLRCKWFFEGCADAAGIPRKSVIKAVWGKAGNEEYWIGNESETIGGHCIWCARAEAILSGKAKTLTIPSK